MIARSPLPFGVLSPGHKTNVGYEVFCSWSPLPFGVLSPGHRPQGCGCQVARSESPLPFGVLSPGHTERYGVVQNQDLSHHCLSAFCPPATLSA